MSNQNNQQLRLTMESDDGATIVHIQGRIDTYTAEQFTNYFDQILESDGDIILDMSELEYVSSAGLRALYHLDGQVDEDRHLVFCNLHHNVDRMFDIVDVKSMFDIYENLDAAKSALEQ